MTQAEVAARLRTSAPYVSSLENGRENVTLGQLTAVAEALDVELRVELHVPPHRPEPDIPSPT